MAKALELRVTVKDMQLFKDIIYILGRVTEDKDIPEHSREHYKNMLKAAIDFNNNSLYVKSVKG